MKVLSGYVNNYYLFDAGGEFALERVERVLNKKPREQQLVYSKLTPEYIRVTPAPLEIPIGKQTIEGTQYEVTARVFAVGVVSVLFRRSFDGELRSLLKDKPIGLEKKAVEISSRILSDLKEALESTYDHHVEPEDYKVIVIKNEGIDAGQVLKENERVIAALLREEGDVSLLSDEEVKRVSESAISYYHDDLAVIGFTGAVVIEPHDERDVLTILELANAQLLELRTYNDLLIKESDRTYSQVREIISPRAGLLLKPARISETARDIAELRLEVTDVVSDIYNMSSFIGDWYIGKLYALASDKLRLKEWHADVERKLDEVEDFYSLALARVDAQRNVWLEFLIVLLIVFEIVLSLTVYVK
ncbi:hypothetical protein HYS54_01915 [Candidatus Micrarchaeota archaeon]|nr:hypothetical protein [Candidatus Micrarchaeota archaeon]